MGWKIRILKCKNARVIFRSSVVFLDFFRCTLYVNLRGCFTGYGGLPNARVQKTQDRWVYSHRGVEILTASQLLLKINNLSFHQQARLFTQSG